MEMVIVSRSELFLGATQGFKNPKGMQEIPTEFLVILNIEFRISE